MVFWPIVIFLLGLVGLIHEITYFTSGIPIFEQFFGEMTSIIIMLVALGMFYSLHRHRKQEKTE
ncbi:hypothetical protein DRQ36_02900 [bacterium]|nr:MAG: hypothetical protein DRQ36_02900 [bacterium]